MSIGVVDGSTPVELLAERFSARMPIDDVTAIVTAVAGTLTTHASRGFAS